MWCKELNTLRICAKSAQCQLRRHVHKFHDAPPPPQAATKPHDELTLEKLDELERYTNLRKSANNVPEIRRLLNQLKSSNLSESDRSTARHSLGKELLKLPNKTHPTVLANGPDPKELQMYNAYPEFKFKPKSFDELAKKANIYRMDHLANFTGHKSYYFAGALAEMEHALVNYTLSHLKPKGFRLISVPDILPAEVIEGCGMQTSGERTQVYKLTENGKCMSGTSEMALAGFFKDKILKEEELPIKLTAVSRCFRAETSGLQEEKGIYRVHQFTKVEMFSVCTDEQSDDILESFKETEVKIFEKLGIHFKILDMPANELGAPAYRKYDIEAWMPGRHMWGEISSCSNCTVYQAKRLNIKYKTKDNQIRFANTVNGTACAVPRLLIALLENNQQEDGSVIIPTELQSYMREQKIISRHKHLPELKLVKHINGPNI